MSERKELIFNYGLAQKSSGGKTESETKPADTNEDVDVEIILFGSDMKQAKNKVASSSTELSNPMTVSKDKTKEKAKVKSTESSKERSPMVDERLLEQMERRYRENAPLLDPDDGSIDHLDIF